MAYTLIIDIAAANSSIAELYGQTDALMRRVGGLAPLEIPNFKTNITVDGRQVIMARKDRYMLTDGTNINDANNEMGFDYNTTVNGITGPFISFGSLQKGDAYLMQIEAPYNDSSRMIFRTRNGDTATWNPWREVWHSGNVNPVKWNYYATAGELNTPYNSVGAYISCSSENMGIGDGWRHYINLPHRDANGFNAQLALPYGTGNNVSVYYRGSSGTVWDAWTKLWDTSNLNITQGGLGYDTGFANPNASVLQGIGYYRIGGMVFLYGDFYRGYSANMRLCWLPSPAVPMKQQSTAIRSIEANEEDCIISITTDGQIVCDFRDLTSGTYNSHAFSLNGIHYPVS